MNANVPNLFKPATKARSKLRFALFGPSGSGKAQPLDAPILTPTGWHLMGDLSIGDYVIGSNGGKTRITGIYPQGMQPVYRITFNDGISVECTDDHLWLTQTILDRGAHRSGTVKSTKEIAATLKDKHGKRQHSIPLVRPVQFESPESLPIDPYLLGVLLGDGHFGEKNVLLCNPDENLRELAIAAFPDGVTAHPAKHHPGDLAIVRIAETGSNPLVLSLRQLGLTGTLSLGKFIPDIYLFGTIATRIALLQGLLDTDGHTSGSTLEYSTSSPHLATQVRYLVESLGGLTATLSRMPSYTYKGEHRIGALSYRLFLRLPGWLAPFRLPRKRDRYIPRTKYQPTRFIDRIELIGEKPVQCIAVDAADHLYVTDHYVVTHNTYTGLDLANRLGKTAVIDTERGSASKYAGQFTFDVLELQEFSPQSYINAIHNAEAAGYDVILIDSLSHAWNATGGVLEMVDKAAKRSQSGNSYTAWRDVTPLHNALIDAIVACSIHVIATMRSKTEYVLETNANGKIQPRKIGLAPIQRDGMEYEFDVCGEMDVENNLIISKSRCSALINTIIAKPGAELAEPLIEWLSDGTEPAHWALNGGGERINKLIGQLHLKWDDIKAVLEPGKELTKLSDTTLLEWQCEARIREIAEGKNAIK